MGFIEGSINRDGVTEVIVAGAVAGNVTVSGIKVRDSLIAVLHDTTDGVLVDLTSEFSITAADTINNVGGTATDSDKLVVTWNSKN